MAVSEEDRFEGYVENTLKHLKLEEERKRLELRKQLELAEARILFLSANWVRKSY